MPNILFHSENKNKTIKHKENLMNTKENKYRIKTLKAILNKLNLDKYFQKLVLQKIEIPVLDTYNPVWEYWYPHPPCLIPLFLGYGAEYSGLVCHFFSQRNPPVRRIYT